MDYSKESNNKKKRSAVSKTKKAQNRIVTVAFRSVAFLVLIIFFAIGGVVIGAYVGIIESGPSFEGLPSVTTTQFNSVVYDMYGNEIWYFHAAGARRLHAPFYTIPQHLINAFIAIEDERFFEHRGVDVRGTLRAAYVTFIARSGVEGGSTITQQLVKNTIAEIHYNNFRTKLQEQFLALQLEAYLVNSFDGDRIAAKNNILYLYLTSIALGPGINGVQMAANHYFGRGVETLTISESAIIASITQSPIALDPYRFPDNNRQRATTVLNRMLAQGLITEAEHAYAIEDLQYEAYARIGNFREYVGPDDRVQSFFIDELVESLVEALIENNIALNRNAAMNLIHGGGLRIHTTMHQTVQRILEETYLEDSHFPSNTFQIAVDSRISAINDITGEQRHFISNPENTFVPNYSAFQNWVYNRRVYVEEQGYTIFSELHMPIVQPQSSMVIIDHSTGHVRGLVGGRGEKTQNLALNRATRTVRQPGSVFKMVASYAPAMDMGLIAPGSPLHDRPFTWPGTDFTPSNFNNRYIGQTNVRQAVARSFNTTALETFYNVGIDRSFDYLLNFGFTTLTDQPNEQGLTDRVPALPLGGLTYGVTQLELAGAFAAIANGGVYIEPTLFTRVYDHDGHLILETNQATRQVIQPTTAYLLTATMQEVLNAGGTGVNARLANGMAASGKTGTSQNTNDIMFAGYSPHFTASVWIGHDQPRSLGTHGGAHTRIWAHVMNRIHAELDKPVITGFARPVGIIEMDFCMDTGLLPTDLTRRAGRVRRDIFAANMVPTAHSNTHGLVRIDRLTGLPATASTPLYRIETVLARVDGTGRAVDDANRVIESPEQDEYYGIADGETTYDEYG
ncbi:MAG: transglycosylase domain-containing protein, partial [Defluviitaleaceae bacterium]|nr:transglycosylase domain-containing protein [Defluviitaleaceae bacterium]